MRILGKVLILFIGVSMVLTACGGGSGSTPIQPTTAVVEISLKDSAITKINNSGGSQLLTLGVVVDNTAGTTGVSPNLVVSPILVTGTGTILPRTTDSYSVSWSENSGGQGYIVTANQPLFTLTYSVVSGAPVFTVPANVAGQVPNVSASTYVPGVSNPVALDSSDIGVTVTYH